MQKSLYAAMVAFFLSGFAMGSGYTGLQSRAAHSTADVLRWSIWIPAYDAAKSIFTMRPMRWSFRMPILSL